MTNQELAEQEFAQIDAILAAYRNGQVPACPHCGQALTVTPDTDCKQVTHIDCTHCWQMNHSDIDSRIPCTCETCEFLNALDAMYPD